MVFRLVAQHVYSTVLAGVAEYVGLTNLFRREVCQLSAPLLQRPSPYPFNAPVWLNSIQLLRQLS